MTPQDSALFYYDCTHVCNISNSFSFYDCPYLSLDNRTFVAFSPRSQQFPILRSLSIVRPRLKRDSFVSCVSSASEQLR